MALELDTEAIERVLTAAGERLDGDWLLLGGALVAVWFEPRRVTEDIDLISIRGSAADRLALMRLARTLGLPVEAVNTAADFFVRRIAGWEREVEVLRVGPRARLLRPTPTLFVLLKLDRMAERDLRDCQRLLAWCRRTGTAIDRRRLARALEAAGPSGDSGVRRRRAALLAALRRREARRPGRRRGR